jgi:hypothetical protein
VNYNKTNSTAVEIILEEIFTDSEWLTISWKNLEQNNNFCFLSFLINFLLGCICFTGGIHSDSSN